MAYSNRGTNLPGIVAGEDLSAFQHTFIVVDSSGRAVRSSAGGRVDAALDNNPGIDVAVETMGLGSVAKIVASEAIPAGSSVASAANGQARVALPGDVLVGACVEAAPGAGQLCSVWISPSAANGNPVLDDAGRDALSPQPPAGFCIWNTDDNAPNYSDGTAWRDAAGTLT